VSVFDKLLPDQPLNNDLYADAPSAYFPALFRAISEASGLRPPRVLEIGSFVGLSAMTLARAVGEQGHVTTIEKFPHFAAIARRNFQANALADRIDLLEGDACDVIASLPAERSFDLIFIDGNKERYADYFLALEPRLSPRGLFVVDDVLFHGDALNPVCRTDKGRGTRAMLEQAARAKNYLRLLLPIGNGILLLLKR
jgi:predicted O-methyltransferase YrrM